MVKDDSLYIIAIVAVVAVVGLVVMATSSSTVMVAEDLPSMVDSDSTAIAGQAISGSSGGGGGSGRSARQAISASGGGSGRSAGQYTTVSAPPSEPEEETSPSEREEETRGPSGMPCRNGMNDPCESSCFDQTYGPGTSYEDYNGDGPFAAPPEDLDASELNTLDMVFNDCLETCNELGWMDDVYCI